MKPLTQPDDGSAAPDSMGIDLSALSTDQELFRWLCQVRALRGESEDPAKEKAAVLALISFELRKLQKYVDPTGKDTTVTQADLDRWRRRIRVAGSVSVRDVMVITIQGEGYQITSECTSIEGDAQCPRFDAVDKIVYRQERDASMKDETNRVIRWQTAVLSELEAELQMKLAMCDWDEEEFGPSDPDRREADERQRAAAGAGSRRVHS